MLTSLSPNGGIPHGESGIGSPLSSLCSNDVPSSLERFFTLFQNKLVATVRKLYARDAYATINLVAYVSLFYTKISKHGVYAYANPIYLLEVFFCIPPSSV
jgi:hypothetical protein